MAAHWELELLGREAAGLPVDQNLGAQDTLATHDDESGADRSARGFAGTQITGSGCAEAVTDTLGLPGRLRGGLPRRRRWRRRDGGARARLVAGHRLRLRPRLGLGCLRPRSGPEDPGGSDRRADRECQAEPDPTPPRPPPQPAQPLPARALARG